MAAKTVHMCLSVRGAITMPDRDLKGWIRDDDGKLLSPGDARNALMDELAKGREVIPMGEACEGFDYVTGCPATKSPLRALESRAYEPIIGYGSHACGHPRVRCPSDRHRKRIVGLSRLTRNADEEEGCEGGARSSTDCSGQCEARASQGT